LNDALIFTAKSNPFFRNLKVMSRNYKFHHSEAAYFVSFAEVGNSILQYLYSMSHQHPFKVLFCFEDEFKFITEIKRTDIQSEDKSLLYKWLHIDKSSGQIWQLTFQSMDQSNGEQIRNFAEGTLTWNAAFVTFNEEQMTRLDAELTKNWLELIAAFLV
jgi:hypothetical protein